MPAAAKTSLPDARPFIITRRFDAPRDRVWQANTECRHLMHWWGPKGFTMQHCTIDLRPGGLFHYGMRSPDGHTMWGKFIYREVVAPERLVFVVSFSDQAAGVTRHPMSPTWPLEVQSTTTFAEEAGGTALTISWAPINATPEERATFDAGHAGMTQGFTGTFDQLAAYLAQTAG